MTADPDIDRALAILAAYGADPARWPADERAGILAIAGEPVVAAALAAAGELDRLLVGWAADVPPRAVDAAAIAELPQQPAPAVAPRRWFTGGALVAAAAAVVALVQPDLRPSPPAARVVPAVAAAAASPSTNGEDALFAAMFTPTVDEEDLI